MMNKHKIDKELEKIIISLPIHTYCPNDFECCESIERLTKTVEWHKDYLECFNGTIHCDNLLTLGLNLYCVCPVRYLINDLYKKAEDRPV